MGHMSCVISNIAHRDRGGGAPAGKGLGDVELVEVEPQEDHVRVHPAHFVDTLSTTLSVSHFLIHPPDTAHAHDTCLCCVLLCGQVGGVLGGCSPT